MQAEINSLSHVGLSEKEARAYFASLELGQSTLTEIAKKASLKRPTAYLALDSLLKQGLMLKTPKRRGNLFTAENPKKLLGLIHQREQELADLIPIFLARQKSDHRPTISFFDGKEEVERIYREEIFPEREIIFYGTDIERLDHHFPGLLPFAHQMWRRNKTKVWDLLTDSLYAKKYKRLESSKYHQIRIAPPETHFYEDNAIVENRIYIISLAEPFLVKVESKNLAATYRSLFLLAWQSAK